VGVADGEPAAAFLFARARGPAGTHNELLLLLGIGREEEAMRTQNQYGELGDYASALIESKAAEVTELYGLTREDREDIEQELAVKVLSKMDKHNPRRGKLTTFLTRVVEHAIGDILDAREAGMRFNTRCVVFQASFVSRSGMPARPVTAPVARSTTLYRAESRTTRNPVRLERSDGTSPPRHAERQ